MKEITDYKSLEAIEPGTPVLVQCPPEVYYRAHDADGHPCIALKNGGAVGFYADELEEDAAHYGFRFYAL